MGRDGIHVNAAAATAAMAKVTQRLQKIASALGSKYTAVLSLPTAESNKLTWFDSGTPRQPARPVFTINATTEREVIARVKDRFAEAMLRDGTEPSMHPDVTVAAKAVRAVWVKRLETSGGDTPFRALSLDYAAWKRRKGFDSRIGVMRGHMLAAVKGAQVIVRKA